MNIDTSPLAGGSMSHVSLCSFPEWMTKLRAALGRTIKSAPELVHLLREGGAIYPHTVEERREQYSFYLSVAAGRNFSPHEGCQDNSYWHARRDVEANAWNVLDHILFQIPEKTSQAVREMRKSTRVPEKIHARMLRGSLGNLFYVIANRQILEKIFEIFNPAAKTSALWWCGAEGKNAQERSSAIFFHWLLLNIWSKHGLPKNRELTTWARRKTFPWLLKLDRLDYINPAALEIWILSAHHAHGPKRRFLPLRARLRKNRARAKRSLTAPSKRRCYFLCTASMKSSKSPANTLSGFPDSCPVR